jgi:4-hydroxybenzoate polyprenyltransferase
MRFFFISDKVMSFLYTTSLFLAISGFFKVLFSGLLFNKIDLKSSVETFLITFSVYGLNKLTDINEDSLNNPDRVKTIKKIESIFKYLVVLSFILSFVLGFLVNVLTLPVLSFPLLLGTLYSVKLSKNLPRLKEITGIKNITIGLSWAVNSTFLPAISILGKNHILILSIFYLLFIKSCINNIIFDVIDIEGDRKNGIITIPVFLGIKNTRKLLFILNSTLIFWLLFSSFLGFFQRYLFILIFIIFYGYWYILHFCKDKKKIGNSINLFVDGEFIMIGILAFIFYEI